MVRVVAYRMRPTDAAGRIGMRPPTEERPALLDTAVPRGLRIDVVRRTAVRW